MVAVVVVADPLSTSCDPGTLVSILVVFTRVIARAPCPMRKVLIPSCSPKEMEAEIHKANCPLSPSFRDRKAIQDLDLGSVTPGALPRLSAPAPRPLLGPSEPPPNTGVPKTPQTQHGNWPFSSLNHFLLQCFLSRLVTSLPQETPCVQVPNPLPTS